MDWRDEIKENREFFQEIKILYPNNLKNLPSARVPKGWHRRVKDVLKDLVSLHQEIDITCIKEKFGGLRIYCSGPTRSCNALIRDAENHSIQICEVCSSEENVTFRNASNYWIRSLCLKCYETKVTNDDNADSN